MTNDAKHIGAVLEVLEQAASESGHVFVREDDVECRLKQLGIDPEQALQLAQRDGFVVVRGDRVYLPHLDQAERDIATMVGRLLEGRGGLA